MSSYPTCSTCKHWRPVNAFRDGQCAVIGVTWDTYKGEGYLLIPAGVGHGWEKSITSRYFGCIKHSQALEGSTP